MPKTERGYYVNGSRGWVASGGQPSIIQILSLICPTVHWRMLMPLVVSGLFLERGPSAVFEGRDRTEDFLPGRGFFTARWFVTVFKATANQCCTHPPTKETSELARGVIIEMRAVDNEGYTGK
ncbi:unnamed protein product [Nezara viridula]|uniref:Uncharacterized protein n=1 Tax=Nezara viridula TaxID=85310 RepID=A0A9P0DZ25_NEZVI|nr:unnamed protein product [Nezara viridula]